MSTKPREQPEVSPCTFISQILVVQADDQDFDVNLVARDPNTLVGMEMVKVRPGMNDMFKKLQSEYRQGSQMAIAKFLDCRYLAFWA